MCAHQDCSSLPPHLCSHNGKILCPSWITPKSSLRDRERPTSPHPRKDPGGKANDAALEDRLAVANRNAREANRALLDASYASESDDEPDAHDDKADESNASSGRMHAHLAAVHGRSVRNREESSRAAAILHSDMQVLNVAAAHAANSAYRRGCPPPDSYYNSEADDAY